MTAQHRASGHLHFIIIFLLVSINLRLAFSAADPLLIPLMHDLGLGISSSGLFGLLPVMSLGVAAPLGARLVAWVRPGYLIIYAMLATICQIPFALLTGLLSRWMGGVRRLMTVATLSAVLACWGLLLAPLPLWPIFALLLGFGMGSIFSIGMMLIATTEPDEAGTIALSGLAQGVGFIGGGLLAWAAGMSLRLPMPDLWLALLYTLLALSGLFFGLRCGK